MQVFLYKTPFHIAPSISEINALLANVPEFSAKHFPLRHGTMVLYSFKYRTFIVSVYFKVQVCLYNF